MKIKVLELLILVSRVHLICEFIEPDWNLSAKNKLEYLSENVQTCLSQNKLISAHFRKQKTFFKKLRKEILGDFQLSDFQTIYRRNKKKRKLLNGFGNYFKNKFQKKNKVKPESKHKHFNSLFNRTNLDRKACLDQFELHNETSRVFNKNRKGESINYFQKNKEPLIN